MRRHAPLLLVLAALAAALLLFRSGSGAGWGAGPRPLGARAAFGLLADAEDNLSYLSWAQQARKGAWRFSDLYTTEPHEAALVNPFFEGVGLASRATGLRPLLLLNLLGFLAALATVALVHRAALLAGLLPRAAGWAAFLTAFGGGLSWVAVLAGAGVAEEGADLRYTDLVPASAFQVFPYQSVGIALSAALLVAVLAAGRAAETGPIGPARLAGVAGAALALAATRPYEPVALAIAVSTAALLGWVDGDRALFRRQLLVAAVVAGAVAPFALQGAWLARLPVWSGFAARSLDLKAPGRGFWILGFGLLWPGAFAGALLVARRGSARLLVTWGAFLAILLLVLNARTSKLAGAGFVALALLSAEALAFLAGRFRGGALVAGLLAAATLPSPLLALWREERAIPTVNPAWIEASRVVERMAPGRMPVVLSTPRAGVFLPGWAGTRVYAGHWSLSVAPERRFAELRLAGLGDPGEGSDGAAPFSREALEALVRKSGAEFVLLPASSPANEALSSGGRAPIASYPGWNLYGVRKGE